MLLIRSVLFTAFFIVFTGLSLMAMAISSLFGWQSLQWVVQFWSRTLCWVLKWMVGLTFEIRGREHISKSPIIYAAKHQSAWDTFIYFQIFETPSYVLKKELHRIPFWGRAAEKYGAISVDRDGGASALKKLVADTKDRLARNFPIIIFPEGTRSAPGSKLPYHPGVAAMYMNTDVPVVPVATNSGLFWGRRSILKRPGVITVEFLPPIPSGLRRRAFMTELEAVVEAATDRLVEEGVAKYPATKIAVQEPKTVSNQSNSDAPAPPA